MFLLAYIGHVVKKSNGNIVSHEWVFALVSLSARSIFYGAY